MFHVRQANIEIDKLNHVSMRFSISFLLTVHNVEIVQQCVPLYLVH